MKARYYLLGCLALASCGAPDLETAGPVVVSFDQPFPANAPDLPGFLPRDWGQYTTPGDTSNVFVVSAQALVGRSIGTAHVGGALLDSLGLPHRRWGGLAPDGLRYHVTPLAADSFQLQVQKLDTVLRLQPAQPLHLRHYRGYYYTSTPSRRDSTQWTVRRLSFAEGHITQQLFNPDSLRVRALDPATVRQRYAKGQLLITISPQSRRDVGQVSSYAGLWLDKPADSVTASAQNYLNWLNRLASRWHKPTDPNQGE